MLTEGHPHAWNIDKADEHLRPGFRTRRLADGGSLVVTPQMRQLAAGVPAWMRRGAAIAISGPNGAGKTTVLEALAAISDVHTPFVTIPGKAKHEASHWYYISTALTGVVATGTAREMQTQAREFITAVPTLLVVDEAQHLCKAALLQLRWLWDLEFPSFAIWRARMAARDGVKRALAIVRPEAPPSVDLAQDKDAQKVLFNQR